MKYCLKYDVISIVQRINLRLSFILKWDLIIYETQQEYT